VGKGALANERVLAEGHAVLDSRPPNVQYADRLRDAQKAAREGKKNVWNPKEPLPESPAEFVKKAAEAEKHPDVPTLAEWREGCVIGNKKSKKFHVSGGRYYESSKESKNAVFFATKDDAIKAGYTESAR
jgi:micrococcal nuclease